MRTPGDLSEALLVGAWLGYVASVALSVAVEWIFGGR